MSPLQDIIAQQVPWPLGIDIGYSAKKKSMALASTIDVFTPFGLPTIHYTEQNGSNLFTSEHRFQVVLSWVASLPSELRRLVVAAIDGPLGPTGWPRVQRDVDYQCQRGQCQNRCVPASVTGGGQQLVAATEQFAKSLFDGIEYSTLCCPPTEAVTAPALLEVNPPIGLAWLVPCVQNWNTLPSRSQPVTWNGRNFKSKSDYYWARGANLLVAAALSCPSAALVQHHERESSLYALAVAQCAVRPNPQHQLFTIGSGSGETGGVYHLLGPIHADWQGEYQRIGFHL